MIFKHKENSDNGKNTKLKITFAYNVIPKFLHLVWDSIKSNITKMIKNDMIKLKITTLKDNKWESVKFKLLLLIYIDEKKC